MAHDLESESNNKWSGKFIFSFASLGDLWGPAGWNFCISSVSILWCSEACTLFFFIRQYLVCGEMVQIEESNKTVDEY